MIEIKDTNTQFHILFDELCIAAAFQKAPCIFGLPIGTLDVHTRKGNGPTQSSDLRNKVRYMVETMEQKGLIRVELSGTVQMKQSLYRAVECMSGAVRIGRIAIFHNDNKEELYCYIKGKTVVYMEYGGHGDAVLTVVEDLKLLKNSETAVLERAMQNPAMSMEVYERKQGYYETLQIRREGNPFSNSTTLGLECVREAWKVWLELLQQAKRGEESV